MKEAAEIALKEIQDLILETLTDYTKLRADFPDLKSPEIQEAIDSLYWVFITRLAVINHKFKEGIRVEKATGRARS